VCLVPKKLVVYLGDISRTKTDVAHKLIQKDCDVIYTEGPDQLLQCIENKPAAIIVLESNPILDWDVIEVTKKIRLSYEQIPIILFIKNSSENLAISALKAGVHDYFKIPINHDQFMTAINNFYLTKANAESKQQPDNIYEKCTKLSNIKIVGASEKIFHTRQLAGKFAHTNSNVLITGETGTGKELIARLIHSSSSRRNSPITCVNCAAIPENLLESELFGHERGAFTGAQNNRDGILMHANKGTLFLDEIGEMSIYAQAKILRAIETKTVQRIGSKHTTPVDIRVIAATNQNLEKLVETKQFRKDLFYRLNVARIHLPPLRERITDIKPLCDHFVSEFNSLFKQNIIKINDEVLSLLLQYKWPGNVRELKNVMEAIFINQPVKEIQVKDLPENYYEILTNRSNKLEAEAIHEEERDKLLVALISTNWNKSKAAEKLNWSRMTLYRKMQKYQIMDDERVGGINAAISTSVTV